MRKPFNPERCRSCGKLAFGVDYQSARIYANWLENNYGYFIRIYWDDYCGSYHFTSQR